MPSFETLLVFTLAALVLNVSPGPSNFYVMSRSIAQGTRYGLIAAVGLASGGLVHVAAAAFGLSALFAASPIAYTVLKLVGAGYLVYLGLRTLFGPAQGPAAPGGQLGKSPRRVWVESALVEILNPKVALFFLAFLPQFADPAAGPLAPQILLLGLIVSVTALPCDCLVALASGRAARLLAESRRFWRWQNRVSGAILIGVGAYVALAKRGAD